MPDPRKPEQNPQHRPDDPRQMPGDNPDMTEEQRRRRGQQKPDDMDREDETMPGQPGRPEREDIDKPRKQ